MHYADIKKADIANGLGVRVSVFVSGCTHHCKNCFNSEAWDFNYGNEFTENEINRVIKELDHSYVSGLSVLGGEPLEHVNQQGLLPLLKRVKEKFPDKNIWCYSGYTFETDIMGKMYNNWKETPEILSYIDVLVDGKFEEDKKDIKLRFRGSSNQRIIDVKKSLKENFYHGILLGLLGYKSNWLIKSNAESGIGYSDILVEVPTNRTGIVIELKYAEDGDLDAACDKALKQIEEKDYVAKLKQDGMDNFIKYGIACFKKVCKVVC